jgi:predicted phosphodiesterase
MRLQVPPSPPLPTNDRDCCAPGAQVQGRTDRLYPAGAMGEERETEILIDLLRSAWIVEQARATVYGAWMQSEAGWTLQREMAAERAGIVAAALERRDREPDHDLVEPHSRWMLSLAGSDPQEEPFGDIFIARLGDWVRGHVSPFLEAGAERLEELGQAEHAALTWPESIPPSPPFEPVEPIDVHPPGAAGWRFGILGDLHFGSEHGEAMARAAVADLNASGAELVIQLGDLTDHGDLDEFELAARVLAELEVPLVTMMGNHDVYSYKEDRISGREYYSTAFGREPDGVILDHKGMKFAVLDSVEHGASPMSPFDLLTGTFLEGPGGGIVQGSLTPVQHDILADVAAPGAGPAFLFLHHPVQPFTGFPPVLFGLRDQDSARLHATCDSGNVWGVFAGHTHRNARTRNFGDVPAHEVAIPRDFPFGYALVDVADSGYAFRFIQISDETLLHEAYSRTGGIHRRYGLGNDEERSFSWTTPKTPINLDSLNAQPGA